MRALLLLSDAARLVAGAAAPIELPGGVRALNRLIITADDFGLSRSRSTPPSRKPTGAAFSAPRALSSALPLPPMQLRGLGRYRACTSGFTSSSSTASR